VNTAALYSEDSGFDLEPASVTEVFVVFLNSFQKELWTLSENRPQSYLYIICAHTPIRRCVTYANEKVSLNNLRNFSELETFG